MTAAVTPQFVEDGGRRLVKLSCPTAGASIAWRRADDRKNRWRLYTGPIETKPGEAIEAKACRIGFMDGEVARIGD